MLTLSLLRHAKSSWDDREIEDFARPLAPRGAKAAPAMGKYLRREMLRPDLVLCSGAVRTRATLALVVADLGSPLPEIRYDDGLYLASSQGLLGTLKAVEPIYHHVLMVGHNPGMHALALELSGDGSRHDLSALATKFPTAALAVIEFDAPSWSDIRPASGKLVRFVLPRDLA